MILINSTLPRFVAADGVKIDRKLASRVALNMAINENAEQAEIDIDGVIGEDWWVEDPSTQNTAQNVRNALRTIKAGKLIVNINSFGGYVNEGLAIHDAILELGKETETRVYGMTASAATIIAQAGTVRKMSKNALYLIHQAWTVAFGNANAMQKTMEDLKQIDGLLLDIYQNRSGKDRDVINELMTRREGEGVWIKAEEALEFGLIDEIIEPKANDSKSKNVIEPTAPPADSSLKNIQASEAIALQLEILNLKAKF